MSINFYASVHDIIALLNIDDSKEIINLAWDYRAKWKFIGIELGIDAGTLDAIEANHKNVEECLADMVNGWLRKNEPRPTRCAISAALQSGRVLGTTGSCLVSVLVCWQTYYRTCMCNNSWGLGVHISNIALLICVWI